MDINYFSLLNTNLIKSIALFYLIIFSNFLLQFLTCFQQNIINKNKTYQFILGYFLFYFLVSLTSDNGIITYTPPIQKLLMTFFYYILFIITLRVDIHIMFIVLLLIFILYFIEINNDYYINEQYRIKHKEDKIFYEDHQYWITLDFPLKIRLLKVDKTQFNIILKLQTILYILIWFLIIIGLIAYGGEIKMNIKNNKDKNFSWYKVFIDTSICDLKDKKGFWFYFKKGLGIKI